MELKRFQLTKMEHYSFHSGQLEIKEQGATQMEGSEENTKPSNPLYLPASLKEPILKQIPLKMLLLRNIFQFTISLLVILGTPLAALLKKCFKHQEKL